MEGGGFEITNTRNHICRSVGHGDHMHSSHLYIYIYIDIYIGMVEVSMSLVLSQIF